MIDIKVLRAAGLTDAQIVVVFEATNPIVAELNELRERLAEIRQQNRKRKQNQRSRHVTVTGTENIQRDQRSSHVTSHVTVTGQKKPNGINGHVTVTGSEHISLFKEDSKKERKKVERGDRLPETWVPSGKHSVLAASLRLSEEEVLFHAEAFREWAGANANRAIGRKANWDLAFNGWLRREGAKPKSSHEQRKGGLI